MKERPILYSQDMVLAKLAGRKDVTRRAVKLIDFRPSETAGYDWEFRDRQMRWHSVSNERLMARCPYGVPGDRLWTRESFRALELDSGQDGIVYIADKTFRPIENTQAAAEQWGAAYHHGNTGKRGSTVPSIHMPRAYSRFLDEVVSIRVERLHDITWEDVLREGLVEDITPDGMTKIQIYGLPSWSLEKWRIYPQDAYFALWDQINGDGAAAKNPWVWRIETKPVKAHNG